MARPKVYKDDYINELADKYREYIDTTDIPIVAEFAYQNGIERTLLYDREELSTLTKMCIMKKEAQLERKSLQGEVNTTQAIFSLKQLGWKDRTDNHINVNVSDLSDDEIEELLKNGD